MKRNVTTTINAPSRTLVVTVYARVGLLSIATTATHVRTTDVTPLKDVHIRPMKQVATTAMHVREPIPALKETASAQTLYNVLITTHARMTDATLKRVAATYLTPMIVMMVMNVPQEIPVRMGRVSLKVC